MTNLDKLNKLASTDLKWIEEAKGKKENRDWQKHSQKIAIKVLMALREKELKQKQLAKTIGVSPQQINKIVKGKENLTLVTIAKLENALNIDLIFIKNENLIIEKEYLIKKEIVYLHIYENKTIIAQQSKKYEIGKEIYSGSLANEKVMNYG